MTIGLYRLTAIRMIIIIIINYYGSTALYWALATFSVSWSCTQSVELLGRGISPSQSPYLHTEQHKNRINAYNTDNHDLSGFKPTIPAFERAKTVHALDRAATVIGNSNDYITEILR
jgi:hypothetical protein